MIGNITKIRLRSYICASSDVFLPSISSLTTNEEVKKKKNSIRSQTRERRSSVVVSTPPWHAIIRGAIPARTRHVILGVKTWLSTLETVYLCVFRMRH